MHSTAMMDPDDDPQYMGALRRANEVRLARAGMRRSVAAGEVDVAEVVLACPRELETLPLAELLSAQRRWGRKRSQELLEEVGLPETKSLGALTQRQRNLVAERLR